MACILIFSASKIMAQTGFFTPNPVHPLQIDAAKDNGATPDATKLSNDVVVTSAGNLGLGVLNPVTKVDLRSVSPTNGIIGVGSNTQTAAVAGGGAIRYNAAGFLDYSDGEQWIALPLTAPTKALVNGYIDTGVSVPSGTSTIITGWKEAFDAGTSTSNPNGDFNNSIFTAPRDGFYLVSFSITLTSNSIARNSYIETAIESVLGSGTGMATTIPKFITVNSYPAYQATIISNFISGNCNAIFQLKAGNQIQFSVKHTTGSARNTVSDRTLNNFSISEL
ncbi:hypothetical protein [Chryseobacterium ginsenosidimutans]|uniref:hypothetical protein n=1 Tax=Chryseobacterium ginsenosidimutans TaxID=687846 RepID=UPI0027BB0CC9|nr:hypothetical protein [Chryseobacterium ginsenosidimutans]